MRGSNESAAFSARFAISIRFAVSRDAISSEYNFKSVETKPNSFGSARPTKGSSVVISASCRAAATIWSRPSCDRSDVYDAPVFLPIRIRKPAPRDPASLSCSTSPSRTCAENSSPSEMVHSASVAPAARARRITSRPRSIKPQLPCRLPSSGRFEQSGYQRLRGRSGLPFRKLRHLHPASNRSRPWRHTSSLPGRCRLVSRS